MRQDAELRNLGLPTAKNGRWQEVFAITAVVFALGLLFTSFLDLSPLVWKIAGFGFIIVGVTLGLIVRRILLAQQAKRLADSKRNARSTREQETQRQLAEMRRKSGDV